MRSITSLVAVAVSIPVSLVLAACSGEAERASTAPDVEDDGLEFAQSVTSGSITMTANTPTANLGAAGVADATVSGSVTYTGSGTSGTGACLLVRVEVGGYSSENWCGYVDHDWSQPVSCTQHSDCNQYQIYSGGFAYCLAPDNSGPKQCYVRPGPNTQFCKGTPAGEGLVTAPTTLTIPAKSAYYEQGYDHQHNYDCREYYGSWENYFSTWVTYGCFGVACTPPSVSRPRYFLYDQYQTEQTGTL
jgi:hypothetical protein